MTDPRFSGRDLPEPGFADDDGSADPALTEALASLAAGSGDPATVLRALNGLLPPDIRVHDASDAPGEFHARYDALSRRYRYTISLMQRAVGRQYAWFVPYRLDTALMHRAAASFLGEHDFASFCRAAADVDHHRCTVTRSAWSVEGGTLAYDVEANRFLHGMVRALVGTMVDVGRGYRDIGEFCGMLAEQDRREDGRAAPACGLALEEGFPQASFHRVSAPLPDGTGFHLVT